MTKFKVMVSGIFHIEAHNETKAIDKVLEKINSDPYDCINSVEIEDE